MSPDLGAQTERETSTGRLLQIPSEIGHGHRTAQKRHRYAGRQGDGLRAGRGDGEREKRVMLQLSHQQTIISRRLQAWRYLGDVAQGGLGDVSIDLNRSAPGSSILVFHSWIRVPATPASCDAEISVSENPISVKT